MSAPTISIDEPSVKKRKAIQRILQLLPAKKVAPDSANLASSISGRDPFAALIDDVLFYLCEFLHIRDLIRMTQVCKSWKVRLL